jgi:signal transduction histidine kinase
MVGGLRDRQILEERLHFAERAAALGRMASAVAHEIRNPLNFINLSIDHMRERLRRDGAASREEFDAALSTMKQEIGRLNRLVAEFLDFGKPIAIERTRCRIDDIVRHVSALVDHKARDQRVKISLDVAEDLPSLSADPELLQTCLLNLTINSLDAMPTGGELKISLRQAGTDAGSIQLLVADTGIGMTAEELGKAFEPYFSTKSTGVGLGLSLTRQILTGHGASILIDSAPGRGTEVKVTFPCLQEEPVDVAVAVGVS